MSILLPPPSSSSNRKAWLLVPGLFALITLSFIVYTTFIYEDTFEKKAIKMDFKDSSHASEPLKIKRPTQPKSESKGSDHCDPYSQPGFYDFVSPLLSNITYRSLNKDCQVLDPSPLSYIENDLDYEALRDKTAVLIGDSVDRQVLEQLCSYIKGNLTISAQDSHDKPAEDPKSGGYPRMCYVEKYNLVISNYFFYGFDRDDIWTDKTNVYLEPGDYTKRIELAKSAIGSLNRKVDVAFVNVGFWELARFDRLDTNLELPEVPALREEYTKEYRANLKSFLQQVVSTILPKSSKTRLVYRENHYPQVESGPFFSSPSTINREHRFDRFKVSQLNQIARRVVEINSRYEYWPIGTQIRDIPAGEYMMDDLHPNTIGAVALWGNAILEYIARS